LVGLGLATIFVVLDGPALVYGLVTSGSLLSAARPALAQTTPAQPPATTTQTGANSGNTTATPPTNSSPTVVPPKTGGYGVFLAGNDMFVGRKSALGALKHWEIKGWGLSNDVVGEAVFHDVLNQQFSTAEEAKAAYMANMVPGSQHPRPLGLGPVARFQFDGGTKEHSVENAFSFLNR
jgi:hypothetical protein